MMLEHEELFDLDLRDVDVRVSQLKGEIRDVSSTSFFFSFFKKLTQNSISYFKTPFRSFLVLLFPSIQSCQASPGQSSPSHSSNTSCQLPSNSPHSLPHIPTFLTLPTNSQTLPSTNSPSLSESPPPMYVPPSSARSLL
jgi:hypothetical protein